VRVFSALSYTESSGERPPTTSTLPSSSSVAVWSQRPVLSEPVNVRRIKVQQRLSGPNFIVTSNLVGSIIAATCDYPLTIVDVPSGVDMTFLLSACADHYGGTVVGYRYG
jgi:hypothetical protein